MQINFKISEISFKFPVALKKKNFKDLLNIDGIGETQINSLQIFVNDVNCE